MSRGDHVHFVGVGGVGMAGLARLLAMEGVRISGSDATPNRLTDELSALGARVETGHRVANLYPLPDWAVRTPAVAEDNPEVAGLRARGVPVYSRGEILARYSRGRHTLAVAGAHGKTTTAAMLAWILRESGVACGYAIGGETALPGRVADAGTDPRFVCEADESDGTLVHYAPRVGVLTHVEWDHPERFPTPAAIYRCYGHFVRRCGRLWIREDDAEARRLCEHHPETRTVGRGPSATLRLVARTDDPRGQDLRVAIGDDVWSGRLRLPGWHNAWNALMALGAAGDAGIPPDAALAALATFPGVGRRFETRDVHGITVVRDYAHHPTEIRAFLSAARALRPQRILMVFQPHRYSRTRRLLEAFVHALEGVDRLDLLPVYAASEPPTLGANSEELAAACRGRLSIPVHLWDRRARAAEALASVAEKGDLIAVVGAGDVGALWDELPAWLDGNRALNAK